MIRVILIAIAAISVAAPAFAEPVTGTATLAAPARKAKVAGEATVWRCTETSCTGLTEVAMPSVIAACTAVADQAGRVTAFAVGTASFGDAELARCNRHVK